MSFIKYLVKIILYQPLFNALIFLVWLIPGHNIAWAIIILTLIIRFLLLPSSMKAIRQQKKMRDLQPQIQELQQKYKDDKQKQSQALMDFYKKNNINPLGSCLPLLIQLPVLIVLYYVFQAGLSEEHFDMLYGFVPRPDYIKTVFLGIDLAKPERFVLPIIAGLTQFVQSWQVMPLQPKKKGEEVQAMVSRQMLFLMPIFTIFIAGRLPAALPLYWIAGNLFSIVQQWWVFKDKSKAYPEQDRRVESQKLNDDRKSPISKTIKKGGVEVTVRSKKSSR